MKASLQSIPIATGLSNFLAAETAKLQGEAPATQRLNEARPSTLIRLGIDPGRNVVAQNISDSGVHDLSGLRVLGTMIPIPSTHAGAKQFANAYRVDTVDKNPTAAIKQYRDGLERFNRIKGGGVHDELTEMIVLNRIGLAHNHLVVASLKDGDKAGAAKHEKSARESIAQSLAIGDEAKFDYGAALYNLTCLEATLGNTDAAFESMQRCIDSSPAFFRSLCDRDSDLSSLWGDARFAALVPTTEKSARPANPSYPTQAELAAHHFEYLVRKSDGE